MSMPLTEQEIFASISPCYHRDFKDLQNTIIQPTEQIFGAFDCSINSPYTNQNKTTNSDGFGYCVITTYRRLLVSIHAGSKYPVTYFKRHLDGASMSDIIFGGNSDYRRWYSPSQITDIGLKRYWQTERQLATLQEVTRKYYEIEHEGKKITLAEFTFGDNTADRRYVVFSAEDGKKIYDLLQIAIQNKGKIPSDVSNPKSVLDANSTKQTYIELLQDLAKLRGAGILTEEEFQSKKAEILSRM